MLLIAKMDGYSALRPTLENMLESIICQNLANNYLLSATVHGKVRENLNIIHKYFRLMKPKSCELVISYEMKFSIPGCDKRYF